MVEALTSLQARPDFHEIVSTRIDYDQTLAHLSICYGYSTLLDLLIGWGIDLTVADVNGLTALHWAYLKGDRDSVRTLRRRGASETVTDKLGRTPSDLQPEGLGEFEEFDSDIDLDAEVVAGADTEMHVDADDIDEQPVLEEALDLDGDNDSGHGQSDSDYAPRLPTMTAWKWKGSNCVKLQRADDQCHE